MSLLIPAVWAGVVAGQAPAPSPADEADAKALQGVWDRQSVETNRPDPTGWKPPKATLLIKGNLWEVREGSEKHFDTSRLFADKKPKQIDLTQSSASGKYEPKPTPSSAPGRMNPPRPARVAKGLYRLEGDTLQLLFGGNEGERPTEFPALPLRPNKGGPEYGLLTFRRQP